MTEVIVHYRVQFCCPTIDQVQRKYRIYYAKNYNEQNYCKCPGAVPVNSISPLLVFLPPASRTSPRKPVFAQYAQLFVPTIIARASFKGG